MESYAIYGHFYDATQGIPSGASYLNLLRRHHPRARSVLEIACGTGAHLAALVRDYEVTGLDISPTMLRYARKKLPQVRFYRQNMAGFKLPGTFDAVICPYDSMNHMLRFTDWVRTFKAAKRHLNPQGIFIFDINTQYRLRDLARVPPWTRRFGDNYLIMTVSMATADTVNWDIKVFEQTQPGRFRLHHEVIKERSFEHQKIMRALRSVFSSVRAYDLVGWSQARSTSRRLFYVCKV